MLLVWFPSIAVPSWIPNKDSAVILTFPPCPCSALAIISLPFPDVPLGKAITKLVSIVKLPPLAFSKSLCGYQTVLS